MKIEHSELSSNKSSAEFQCTGAANSARRSTRRPNARSSSRKWVAPTLRANPSRGNRKQSPIVRAPRSRNSACVDSGQRVTPKGNAPKRPGSSSRELTSSAAPLANHNEAKVVGAAHNRKVSPRLRSSAPSSRFDRGKTLKKLEAPRHFEQHAVRRRNTHRRSHRLQPSRQRLQAAALAISGSFENLERPCERARRIELDAGLDTAVARLRVRGDNLKLAMQRLDDRGRLARRPRQTFDRQARQAHGNPDLEIAPRPARPGRRRSRRLSSGRSRNGSGRGMCCHHRYPVAPESGVAPALPNAGSREPACSARQASQSKLDKEVTMSTTPGRPPRHLTISTRTAAACCTRRILSAAGERLRSASIGRNNTAQQSRSSAASCNRRKIDVIGLCEPSQHAGARSRAHDLLDSPEAILAAARRMDHQQAVDAHAALL